VAGIHGKDYKHGLSLGSFIQLSQNQVKAKAAFSGAIAALNGVALEGILVHLALKLNVRFIRTSAA